MHEGGDQSEIPAAPSRLNSFIAHFSENRKSGRKKRKIKNQVKTMVASEKNFISKKLSSEIRDSYETGGVMYSEGIIGRHQSTNLQGNTNK